MRRTLCVILLAMLAACGGDGTVVAGPDDLPDSVTIAAGELLEVRLRGNPTTGYDWDVAGEGVLRLADRSHRPDTDADGSPGVTTLVFEPAGTGTTMLVLVYHRAWETDAQPLQRVEIRVTVTP